MGGRGRKFDYLSDWFAGFQFPARMGRILARAVKTVRAFFFFIRPRKENLARVELFDNVLTCRETTRFKSPDDIRAGGVPHFVPDSKLLRRRHVDQFQQRFLESCNELVFRPRADFGIRRDLHHQREHQNRYH